MTDKNPYQPQLSASDATGVPVKSTSDRIGKMIVYALLALLFGGNAPRIVPGGPFISLIGDILPTAAACAAIYTGFRVIRGPSLPRKVIAVLAIVIATVAIGRVLASVYTFWVRPYARGSLIGL